MTPEERAFLVAEKAHRNQTYDIYPYLYHVKQVHVIAKQLGYDENIRVACILHDALEDTELSYNDLKKAFGEEVAEIVYCVTDELGRNREERKTKTYPKILSNWKATVVKLCDRIANMGQSRLYNPDKYKMYLKEMDTFCKELKYTHSNNEVERAWKKMFMVVGTSVKVGDVEPKVNPVKTVKQIKNREFKKGDWLIAKWDIENGGEIDFCKFVRKSVQGGQFHATSYFRFDGVRKIEQIKGTDCAYYNSTRFEFGFRLATKAEIKKYTTRIANFKKK